VSIGENAFLENLNIVPGSGGFLFTGAVRHLNITAPNATFILKSAMVFDAVCDGYNTTLIVDGNSTISNLEARQQMRVIGDVGKTKFAGGGTGQIGSVTIRAGGTGSSFETHPNKVLVPNATTVFLAGNEYINSSGGNKTYMLPSDSAAPEISNSALVAADIRQDRMTITWKAAGDNTTAKSKLRYMLFRCEDRLGMDTVEGIERYGTPVMTSYAANTLKATATRLRSDTDYYFNVIVMDEAGNKACYSPLKLGLAGDNSAPLISNTKLTITAPVPPSKDVKFSWQKARDVDDVTPPEYLTYTLYRTDVDPKADALSSVYDWIDSGTVVMKKTENVGEVSIANLTANKLYYFTVVVSDTAGNSARYSIEQFGLDAKAPALPKDSKIKTNQTEYTAGSQVVLSWNAADDTAGGIYGTPQSGLRYKLYQTEKGKTKIEDIKAQNMLILDSLGASSAAFSAPSVTSYYALIVEDEAGLETVYPIAEVVVLVDSQQE
jgi:hypothetical protein